MNKVGLKKYGGQLATLVFFMLAAMGASAQTSELQYKVIGGQVYAFEPSNPEAMYLLPNVTPSQVKLEPQTGVQTRQADILNLLNPGLGRSPNSGGPASSNSALSAITFRDPLFSPQNRQNSPYRIDGLPRYPGKNYPSSN